MENSPLLATAHRGDSSRFRENTIVAIQSAIDSGAQIVEIDIRQSKDGHIIVLHDSNLERLWGFPAEASSLNLDEISQIGFAQFRIPTLVSVLELFQQTKCSIMIDMDTPNHAVNALNLVEASGLDVTRVIWCGNVEAMRLIRQNSSTSRIWAPWNENKSVDIELVKELSPEFINSHFSFWTTGRIAEVHALGLKASAWTIDDAPTMRWAKSIGIDSVTTNNLELLQKVIADDSGADPLDIDRAIELAQSIGSWAIQVCNWMVPGDIQTKANPADLVTEVDLFIESHAREMIQATFPTHNIIGEVFGGEFDPVTPCWYIDPVDGTTNFANRTPWSSFSLSLAVGTEPLVGVTIDPWRNKLFQAAKGRGATVNGLPLVVPEPIDASTTTPLAGRVVLTELAGSEPWHGFQNFIEGLHKSYCTMRVMGAGTLTLTATAANYGIGSVVHRFSPIDHLAAALIAKEAGCMVLNEQGEEDLFPTKGGMLIVQPDAAEALFKLWSAAIA
jgi:myo-inositol-1(or 4)-monophosphatase/deoxyribonuclease-2